LADLGKHVIKQAVSVLISGKLNLAVREGREVIVNVVDEAIAELATGGGVEIEEHGNWIPRSKGKTLVTYPKIVGKPRSTTQNTEVTEHNSRS